MNLKTLFGFLLTVYCLYLTKIFAGSLLSITIGTIDSISIFPSIIAPAVAQTNDSQADRLRKTGDEQIGYNQLFAAENILLQALRLYQSQSSKEGERETLISLGDIYFRWRQYQKASQYLQQAEAIGGKSLTRLWNVRGQIYLESGEYLKAYFSFQRALNYPKIDLEERNRVDIGLGEAYRYLGQYKKANVYLELATRKTGNRYDRGRIYNSSGELYFDLGQYDKALIAYQEALATRKAIGDYYGSIRTLSNLGRVYQQSQKIEEAIASYEEADRLSTSLGDWRSKMYILNNLSTIYQDKGDKSKALSYLQNALAVGKDDRSGAKVETLNSFGKFYLQDRQYDKALEYYQQARNLSSGLNYTFGEGKSLICMGEATLLKGDNKKAIEYIEAGIQKLESLRPGLTDEQKVAIFDTQAYAYIIYQKALIEIGDDRAALIVAERGRSRAFVEQLAKRIDPNQDNENIQPPTIEGIQTIAKTAKATIVEYSILSDRQGNERDLLFWVIKPTGEIIFRRLNLENTPDNTQDSSLGTIARSSLPAEFRGLQNLTASLRGDLKAKTESNANVEKSTRTAHATLIVPIVDLLPTNPDDRVIFIPQASLFLIPFPALQDSNGKYLIEQHTISLAPSIQILGLTQQRTSRNNPEKNLIIGNPAPFPENLASLPGAETEAKEIAAILQSKPLIGTEATETAVIAQIKQASLIHLATHGFFDERQGLQSSLAFSTADKEDGLLTADDILNLNLQADLAVLSACDTGRGQITGDGVIGLSRSFIAAGVPSVIVSLWSVPDLPTAQLMVEFYRHRQQGMDTTQSLRQAMLTVRKTYPNPVNWAAFVAIGQPN